MQGGGELMFAEIYPQYSTRVETKGVTKQEVSLQADHGHEQKTKR